MSFSVGVDIGGTSVKIGCWEGGRPLICGGDGVGVDVHRERGRGVTEPIGHDLDRHAGLEAERGVGVAEVVQPDLRETEPPHGPVEGLREVVGVNRIAVLACEHEVLIPVP